MKHYATLVAALAVLLATTLMACSKDAPRGVALKAAPVAADVALLEDLEPLSSTAPRPAVTYQAFLNEPARFLDAVGTAARVYYVTNGEYPVGQADWTSTRGCCQHHNQVCETDPRDWGADPMWSALGVTLQSPHRFLYRYRGTRDRFEVEAEGDFDCDTEGTTRMWVQGTVENGGPALKFGRQDER